jgi:hypothetical protein
VNALQAGMSLRDLLIIVLVVGKRARGICTDSPQVNHSVLRVKRLSCVLDSCTFASSLRSSQEPK